MDKKTPEKQISLLFNMTHDQYDCFVEKMDKVDVLSLGPVLEIRDLKDRINQ